MTDIKLTSKQLRERANVFIKVADFADEEMKKLPCVDGRYDAHDHVYRTLANKSAAYKNRADARAQEEDSEKKREAARIERERIAAADQERTLVRVKAQPPEPEHVYSLGGLIVTKEEWEGYHRRMAMPVPHEQNKPVRIVMHTGSATLSGGCFDPMDAPAPSDGIKYAPGTVGYRYWLRQIILSEIIQERAARRIKADMNKSPAQLAFEQAVSLGEFGPDAEARRFSSTIERADEAIAAGHESLGTTTPEMNRKFASGGPVKSDTYRVGEQPSSCKWFFR